MNDTPIISQDTMAALLGRPLDSMEVENYALYLQIAVDRIEDLLCIEVASFEELPADLELLIARCFATIRPEQRAISNYGISSKKVEDFQINYHTELTLQTSPMETFVKQNASIIDKYGQCQAEIRSGCTNDCIRCI